MSSLQLSQKAGVLEIDFILLFAELNRKATHFCLISVAFIKIQVLRIRNYSSNKSSKHFGFVVYVGKGFKGK